MDNVLKSIKETLISAAQGQMGNLEQVNAKELGEVIDMIKDLEEAAYYCSITKAMDESKEEKKDNEKLNTLMYNMSMMQPSSPSEKYYSPYYRYPYMEEMYYDGRGGRRGYSGGTPGGGNMGSGNSSYYGGQSLYSGSQAMSIRDYREGRSPVSRRGYMESKETHQDKAVQLQELEKYVNELGQDITEMIQGASPEEKAMLQQKLTTLSSKIK